MSLYIVRHGETDGNKNRVVQVPETPLNEHGLRQADRVAERFADSRVSRVIASDLARARMTAEPIADRLGLALEFEPLLQERNFGDLRGHSYDSLEVDIHMPGYDPPGGESWPQFHARVDQAFAAMTKIVAAEEGECVFVTHGMVCYSLAERHLRLQAAGDAPMRWGNTSVTQVEEAAPWRVELLNCVDHLDESSTDDRGTVSGI